jgi:5,10-methylene-tetrahydrofolate dehydrogenase/methenyl tetrahydrofolate cyclohydrolase
MLKPGAVVIDVGINRVEGRGPERPLGERRQQRIDRDLRYRSFVILYTQERVPVG